MADVRKRPLEDDQDLRVSKKRAVSSATDSPVPVNGNMATAYEDPNEVYLEKFRKEAIYRRMRQYSRENERAQEQIEMLERRRDILQANMAAINACWEQLVQEVRTLVQPNSSVPGVKQEELEATLSNFVNAPLPETSSEELAESLEDRSKVTRTLISKLLSSKPSPPAKDDLRQQCSRLREEVAVLHADLSLANTRISEIETERDQYHTRLLQAESRLDRLRGISAQAREDSLGLIKSQSAKSLVIEDAKEELSDMKPSLTPETTKGQPFVNGHTHPTVSDEDQSWKALYENCSRRNDALLDELEHVKTRCNTLEAELTCPSIDVMRKSPLFDNVLMTLQSYKESSKKNEAEANAAREQIQEMLKDRNDFEEKLIADYDVRYDEQKNLITRKEVESTRLREARDTLQAEIVELKARMAKRESHIQLQILCNSRGEEIEALKLQVKRLKAELAVKAGNSDLLDLVLGDKLEELPERLQESERKLEALRSSMEALDKERPDIAKHIRAESQAKELLVATTKRLERLEAVFGPGSPLPPDQLAMAKKLQEKTELLEQSKLQHTYDQESATALYTELEKLNAAWEILDRQNSSKILEMDTLETKLAKVVGEKAKADNKYFSAMRAKEAAEAEVKAYGKAAEKWQKSEEQIRAAERLTSGLLDIAKAEIDDHKKRALASDNRIADLERELEDLKAQHDLDKRSLEELRNQLTEALAQEKLHRNEARRHEEDSIRARKESERAIAKASTIPSKKLSNGEAELQEKYEKSMKILRCSTCQTNLRSHVLTKCMHTFCKECVQARIDTRQRKCPACNLGFSQGEFQQLYFQG